MSDNHPASAAGGVSPTGKEDVGNDGGEADLPQGEGGGALGNE